ncbi:MAG: hypothetical protein JWP63_2188 [Candidatus Solibacter sp.]|nr:hypothetical protein [Candidatus Solibacter sp.]
MEDLENERAMIVEVLKSMNFEPVNAESLLPDGATSWDRISEELESCHVLLLLSGTRYGWIPTSGPLAQDNISVTHGEYRAARKLGLPVLPFFKDLGYKADKKSKDAKLRDAFRKEVEGWDNGQFRSIFKNVVDLSAAVGGAVVRMLSDHFQRDLIEKRRMLTVAPVTFPPVAEIAAPEHLRRAVVAGNATLWVGSGISLRAGLPSSAVLTTELVRSIQEKASEYAPPSVGSGIASVASDFEMLQGRDLLLHKLTQLLDLPGGITPTDSHLHAVELFPRIITTNYDRLLEAAAEAKGTGHTLVVGPKLPSPVPEKFIWKIHGAADYPNLLVMSEADLVRFEEAGIELQSALKTVLESGPLLVAGTSLRDPSVLRLFRALRPVLDGYWTVFPGDILGKLRARDLRLEPIEGTLESVLVALLRPGE